MEFSPSRERQCSDNTALHESLKHIVCLALLLILSRLLLGRVRKRLKILFVVDLYLSDWE